MTELPSLTDTIAHFGLRTKKSLGQHFLLDTSLCEQIAQLAGNLSGVHAIEIGPGPGGLTRALLTSDAASVTVIEKDARAIPALAMLKPFSNDRLTILEQDALSADLTELTPAPRAIIANLPYNIGTELLLGWLDEIAQDATAYQSLTLMFQKEVGERLAAQPCSKAYGRLSVIAQWLCNIELRMLVPKDAFSPPPKVESVIVQLTPRAQPLCDVPKDALERVLAVAFQQRRKMLRSALKSLNIDFAALHIDDTLRPDQLSIEQFAAITKQLL
jgi:16S rRNA (adenine1518-N6/adenine1519-N6)-dimethyltransferase